MRITARSLVLAGQGFAPQAITDHWLITKGVVPESKIFSPRVATNQFAIVTSSDFSLQVFPEKMQFHINELVNYSHIRGSLHKLLDNWTFGRATACGINVHCLLNPSDPELLSRQNLKPTKTIHGLERARFGTLAVLENAIEGAVMKMVIAPEFEDGDPSNKLRSIEADFNFHLPLTQENGALKEAKLFFDQYEKISDFATTLLAQVS
ncbi:MAG: hypothetical protein JNL58_04340 [Planctomyces sp.]|nr:hypothetical protein [Planctomyces sp.]